MSEAKRYNYIVIPVEVHLDIPSDRRPDDMFKDLAMDVLRTLEKHLYPCVRIPTEGNFYFSEGPAPNPGDRSVHFTRSYIAH